MKVTSTNIGLNSIKHGSSCQPFYPTWIMSAYVMSLVAKKLGYLELVDIGSGDGRIAYCGKILDLNSHSIEIDDVLVNLQNTICSETNQNFNPKCDDALEFEYSKLNLKKPVFFIGGLAQMGGDILATSIIKKINSISNLKMSTGIVLQVVILKDSYLEIYQMVVGVLLLKKINWMYLILFHCLLYGLLIKMLKLLIFLQNLNDLKKITSFRNTTF